MNNELVVIGATSAADYIERHGHCKNRIEDSAGRVCAVGALLKVDASTDVDIALEFVIGEDIPTWNNAPERTKEEVIQAFRDLAIKHQSDEMSSNG